MDPISIDLTSVAGIVALTIGIMQYIKGWLGQQPVLKSIPLPAYVVFVSAVLTFAVHEYTTWLPGDTKELLQQAVLQALVASGAFEWFRSGTKPASASTAARSLRLIPIVIAVGLSAAACASTGRILVESDRGIHATLATADDVVNRWCDNVLRPGSPAGTAVIPPPRAVADCRAFNASLADAYAAYQRYNAGIQANSLAAAPAMVTALSDIHAAIIRLKPEATMLIADVEHWIRMIKELMQPQEKSDAEDQR